MVSQNQTGGGGPRGGRPKPSAAQRAVDARERRRRAYLVAKANGRIPKYGYTLVPSGLKPTLRSRLAIEGFVPFRCDNEGIGVLKEAALEEWKAATAGTGDRNHYRDPWYYPDQYYGNPYRFFPADLARDSNLFSVLRLTLSWAGLTTLGTDGEPGGVDCVYYADKPCKTPPFPHPHKDGQWRLWVSGGKSCVLGVIPLGGSRKGVPTLLEFDEFEAVLLHPLLVHWAVHQVKPRLTIRVDGPVTATFVCLSDEDVLNGVNKDFAPSHRELRNLRKIDTSDPSRDNLPMEALAFKWPRYLKDVPERVAGHKPLHATSM